MTSSKHWFINLTEIRHITQYRDTSDNVHGISPSNIVYHYTMFDTCI